ncbi:hypothetical protein KEM56_004724 [Ascosphaera pollenicola]|nr:hypothetical protein KEM56_004724 [Ascosphaera pollenicola]
MDIDTTEEGQLTYAEHLKALKKANSMSRVTPGILEELARYGTDFIATWAAFFREAATNDALRSVKAAFKLSHNAIQLERAAKQEAVAKAEAKAKETLPPIVIQAPPPPLPPAPAAASTDDPVDLPNRRYRQLRDLPQGPTYDGTKPKAAARHWLRACLDHFSLKEGLVGIRSNKRQRVLLASSLLKGKALKVWDSDRLVSREACPQTWPDFEDWVLQHFDELNAQERLWEDFLKMRQTVDVQSYATEFMIAFQLTGATLDHDTLRRHFIRHLKPALAQE